MLTLAIGPAARWSVQVMGRDDPESSSVYLSRLPYPTIELFETGRGLATTPGSLAAGRYVVSLTAASAVSSCVHFVQVPEHLCLDEATDQFLAATAMDLLPGGAWTFAGGSWANPGTTVRFMVHLTAGTWHIGATASRSDADGTWQEEATLHRLEVSRTRRDTAPTFVTDPDLRIGLDDFDFTGLVPSLQAGPDLWEVSAIGSAARAMVLFRTEGRISREEFVRSLTSALAGHQPAHGDALDRIRWSGYTGLLSPGQSMVTEFDLAPGDYIATSWVTDPETQGPALARGMYRAFTVVRPIGAKAEQPAITDAGPVDWPRGRFSYRHQSTIHAHRSGRVTEFGQVEGSQLTP